MKARVLSKQDGFVGITELLVIIAIIGILTAVTSPAFKYVRERAKDAVAVQDMGNVLRPAIEAYRVEVGEFPSTLYSLLSNPYTVGDKRYTRWASAGPFMRSDYGQPPQNDTDPRLEDPWGRPYMIFSNSFTSCVVVSTGKKTGLGLDTNVTATISSTEPNRDSGNFSGSDDMGIVLEGFN